MKKTAILLTLALSIGLTGCSKDAEVQAFINEFDGVTKEIVSKIDAKPSSDGIDEAQAAFDARKPALKQKWDGIKNAVGIQVSSDTKKKLQDSVAANVKAVTEASMRNMMKMAADKNASAKFKKLMEDYSGTFAM